MYAMKQDGRHKDRMFADGYFIDVPLYINYSGEVSLCGLILVLFLVELNNLDTCSKDIENVYLEAESKEKVFIIAGKEFGLLSGNLLVINKSLYGLRISVLRWNKKFSDYLRA